MIFDKKELKKLLKEKNVKDLDDFNVLMNNVHKEVVEALLEGELTDHLGFEKYDHQAKAIVTCQFNPKMLSGWFAE